MAESSYGATKDPRAEMFLFTGEKGLSALFKVPITLLFWSGDNKIGCFELDGKVS